MNGYFQFERHICGLFFLQVLNDANLTNAILVRSVLTRSDLGGALIEGADFSDAVIDLPQKQVILGLTIVTFLKLDIPRTAHSTHFEFSIIILEKCS